MDHQLLEFHISHSVCSSVVHSASARYSTCIAIYSMHMAVYFTILVELVFFTSGSAVRKVEQFGLHSLEVVASNCYLSKGTLSSFIFDALFLVSIKSLNTFISTFNVDISSIILLQLLLFPFLSIRTAIFIDLSIDYGSHRESYLLAGRCLSPFKFFFVSTCLSERCAGNWSVFPSSSTGKAGGTCC